MPRLAFAMNILHGIHVPWFAHGVTGRSELLVCRICGCGGNAIPRVSNICGGPTGLLPVQATVRDVDLPMLLADCVEARVSLFTTITLSARAMELFILSDDVLQDVKLEARSTYAPKKTGCVSREPKDTLAVRRQFLRANVLVVLVAPA